MAGRARADEAQTSDCAVNQQRMSFGFKALFCYP
jgi:hypothetical protein